MSWYVNKLWQSCRKSCNIRLIGFVWIELILLKLKTENWKHCNKIIFKCVNSTVRPIFNEKVEKKWSLWDPWRVHLCTVHKRSVNSCDWKKEKKKEKTQTQHLNVLSKHTHSQVVSESSFSVPKETSCDTESQKVRQPKSYGWKLLHIFWNEIVSLTLDFSSKTGA